MFPVQKESTAMASTSHVGILTFGNVAVVIHTIDIDSESVFGFLKGILPIWMTFYLFSLTRRATQGP